MSAVQTYDETEGVCVCVCARPVAMVTAGVTDPQKGWMKLKYFKFTFSWGFIRTAVFLFNVSI